MKFTRLRSLVCFLTGLLATASSAWSQGVFIDRFFDGLPVNADNAPGFWTDLHAAPSTTREMYNRLRFHAEGAPATSEVYAGLGSAPSWRGNFIQSEKTFSIRGISLGLSPTSALVFALNSRKARENDSVPSDAVALRLEQADNRVQLAWKLDLGGPPSNVLLDYNAEAPVHGFILKLTATTYQLTVIHETGRDDLPAAAFPSDWDSAKWDNQGDASLIVRGIRKSNTGGILANQTWIDLVEVGGARLLEPFSDATPTGIGAYWPGYWTSVLGGAGGAATETGGKLVLKAGAGTSTGSYLVDTPSHEFGNFTRFPKTYALNGIQLAGDTGSAAEREFVFAVNSENTAEDSAGAASDAFRLRVAGNNNVKLEWKLNTAGAPLNTLVNQTVNGAVTDARLTLDRWRYALTVNHGGGNATFSGVLNPLSWNPNLWNDDGLAADTGKSALLLRANKAGATGTHAQASLASAAVYEPAFASDFEGSNPEADGWIVERYIPPVDNSPRVRVTTDRALSGTKSVRCEVRRTDANVSSGKRAEVVRHKVGGQGTERWYSFGVFLEDWHASPFGEIIAQWIQEPDEITDGRPPEEPAIGPSLTLAIVGDRWVVDSRYDPRYITPVGQKQMNSLVIYTSAGPVEKNQWVDFVVRIKWSTRETNPDGVIQIWKNGVLIVNKTRANCYNNLHDVYFKAGIYRYSWNSSIPPTESPLVQWRILYLDAVKIADDYLGLNGVKPR